MFSSTANIMAMLGDFRIEGMMMRYSAFVPRLYNFCKSLGFESEKIMPSRAFCSDENQGYPIILITKHFGTFPFNHGQVGGIVATDRHGPHAEHGKDMVIIQASHVGYDPERKKFGTYRRVRTEHGDMAASCGKIVTIRFANIVLPLPGGPSIRMLCWPAAAIVTDRLALVRAGIDLCMSSPRPSRRSA